MKQALLSVDVQAGLFLADPLPLQAEAVLERINDLAGRARAAAVPVLSPRLGRYSRPSRSSRSTIGGWLS
ncbi:hypothetical protein [Pseudomonas sp. MBLB4136]|uniref:hypothetical protein n=1 Tax=Pseudomonas sp. MBLB4136 TaxID=3451558 RepID=UPI003F74E26E